jgi:hypothetical protein
MYYPGLWIKHRSKCPAIRRLEGRTAKPEVSLLSLIQTQERLNRGVSSDAYRNHRLGGTNHIRSRCLSL